MTRVVAIDWGTSSLRAALLDPQGQVVDETSSADGILAVAAGGFPAVFEKTCGAWLEGGGTLCLLSGMVGSRQGWLEAPYCECPAGLSDVARRLAWVPEAPGGARVAIVPGLSCEHDGMPDVMRGEETQVFGAMALLGLSDGTFVLPGTHSKWVQVRAGRVESFSTFMTGEVYGLLRRHSILARTLPEDDGPLDEAAFHRGVEQAGRSGSLLQAAFSARTLALFDRIDAAALPSYLSGLVIGEELRTRGVAAGGAPLVLVGADALTRRYRLALEALGAPARCVGADAAWQGLRAIARDMELS